VAVWPPGFFLFWELYLKFDLLSQVLRACILARATAIYASLLALLFPVSKELFP
jgi:hypothetical protein